MQFSRARPGVKGTWYFSAELSFVPSLTDRRPRSAHLENRKGSEPAGLTIDGQALNTDLEESFDTYKTFEIEFETENGEPILSGCSCLLAAFS